MKVFGNRVLERGEERDWQCLGTCCWRGGREEYNGVWEQSAGEKRRQRVTVFGNRVLGKGEEKE